MVIALITDWFTPNVLFCVTNLIIAVLFVASNNNNNNDNKHRDHVHGDSIAGFTRVSSFLERAKSINLSSYTTTTELQHNHYPSQSNIANFTSSSRLAESILTPPSQPVHTPSLLERVKSIKLSSSSYNENAFPTESVQISNSPSQLTRAPSFSDRVKSFRILGSLTHTPDHNVIRSKSENTSVIKKKLSVEMKKSPSETKIAKELQHDHYPSQSKIANYTSSSRLAQSILTPPSQPVHTPSLLERDNSIKFSSSSSSYNENAFSTESVQISNSPSQLTRAPSFSDRVKSFRILSSLTHTPDHNVIRSKSENTSVIKTKLSVEMKKSPSETKIAKDEDEDVDVRRPATTRESRTVVDEEVDAKAEDFISRFKQQLKLQRLESLVRYNELLKRRS